MVGKNNRPGRLLAAALIALIGVILTLRVDGHAAALLLAALLTLLVALLR